MMKSKLLGVIFSGMLMVTVGTTANAVPMLQGPTNAATGINNLVISGVTYNVTFSNFGGFDIRGENPPTFLGNLAGALAAANAIQGVLNGLVTGITNLPSIANHFVKVPYFLTATDVTSQAIFNNPVASSNWAVPFTDTIPRATNFGNNSWTSFTRVPEPGTLALFGLGLAGLGFARRRKAAA